MIRALVVGGGAAGFFGAIRVKEINPGAQVVLAEASQATLKKVRISGGGRCNVTHNCFDPAVLVRSYPRGERELRSVFARFQPRDTVAWFESRGIRLKAEADGRMFPTTDDSETIAACLESEAEKLGVELRLGAGVRKLTKLASGDFAVEFTHSLAETFTHVLLATGGTAQSYELARSLGHEITPLAPSLFTFNVRDPRLADLSGLSFPMVELELRVPEGARFRQTGPLLVTHWGLSGPAVLKLSAFAARELKAANYAGALFVNFAPGKNQESALALFEKIKMENPRKQVANVAPCELPGRYWERLLAHAGVTRERPWSEVGKRDLATLARELTRAEFTVAGKGVFKEEFVTCGGVARKEVDFRTLESKLVPRLYFAGEVLDIDGITGGFNFQNAWSTSWIAGSAIAKENG